MQRIQSLARPNFGRTVSSQLCTRHTRLNSTSSNASSAPPTGLKGILANVLGGRSSKARQSQEEEDVMRAFVAISAWKDKSSLDRLLEDPENAFPPFKVQKEQVSACLLEQLTPALQAVQEADKLFGLRPHLFTQAMGAPSPLPEALEPVSAPSPTLETPQPEAFNPDLSEQNMFFVPTVNKSQQIKLASESYSSSSSTTPSAPSESLESLKNRVSAISHHLNKKFGYSFYVDQSPIAGAGLGLFLQGGEIRPGALVGVYPGTVYLPAYMGAVPFKTAEGGPNLWLMSRYDGTIINGDLYSETRFSGDVEAARQSQATNAQAFAQQQQQAQEQQQYNEQQKEKNKSSAGVSAFFSRLINREMQRMPTGVTSSAQGFGAIEYDPEIHAEMGTKFSHPFALPHMANHPPRGYEPNILSINFDLPISFPRELLPYIPNSLFRPPTVLGGSSFEMRMKCVAYIATRRLSHGDELLVDYRLNPSLPTLPDWYWPVDAAAASRRWSR